MGFLRDRAEVARQAALIEAGGLAPGQTILEMEPGKGKLSGGLTRLVARGGTLILQQPAPLDAFYGRTAQRRAGRALGVRYSDASREALDAPDGTVDRAVWLQGPHELWFEPAPGLTLGRPSRVFAEIARVLAPDGQVLLVDNLAPPGIADARCGALHRSDPRTVAALARDVGLRLLREDEEWVAAPDDPLTAPPYNRAVSGAPRQWMQLWTRS